MNGTRLRRSAAEVLVFLAAISVPALAGETSGAGRSGIDFTPRAPSLDDSQCCENETRCGSTGGEKGFGKSQGFRGPQAHMQHGFATGHPDRPSPSPTATPLGTCRLFPIALHTTSVDHARVGDVLRDILNGSQAGNFGWLTWSGDPSAPALARSLTPPGNSETYINPDNPDDRLLSIGDWAQGRPGLSNSSAVRDALARLTTEDIVVPVWDIAAGHGNNTLYRIANFAAVRVVAFALTGKNQVSARFLGYAPCAERPPPTASPTRTAPATLTATPAVVSTSTPTASATPTTTRTPSPASTATATPTPTPTQSPADTSTGTPTPSDTPTLTPSDTASPTDTATATATQTVTPTDTPPPTATRTATLTQTPTSTPTATPEPPAVVSPTATVQATATPTETSMATAACIEPMSGLVVWLPADGNANEIQARQDGLAQAGVGFAPGMVGQAFSLNGVDQYVLVPDKSNQYPGAGSFTVEAWIQTSAVVRASVVSKHECGNSCFAGSHSAYELFLDSSGHAAAFLRDSNFFGAGLQVTGTTVVADGAFHHLAMMRDVAAGELRLYVDGALEARSALNAESDGTIKDDDFGPDDLLIGAVRRDQTPDPSGFFSGLIDEVQLFDRALGDSEVEAIFDAGSDGQCKAGRATPGCAEGVACATGFPGICANGHTTCPTGSSGPSVCAADRAPVEEVCASATDDDCDGETDEADCRNDAAPTAQDDAYDVRAGETLDVVPRGVLVNDSDPEGDPLTARIARGPMAGTLSFNRDGSFAYTPDPISTGNVNERLDLTRLQRPVVRASSVNFSAENLIDGRLLSFFNSWIPLNDDRVPFAELIFDPPTTVREIRYFASDGPRFTAGEFELLDSSGTLLFTTGEIALPPPLTSIVVDVEGSPGGPIAHVARVRFLGRGIFTANRSVAEIQVFGDGAVPAPAAPAEVNLAELFAVTLNASSFQDDFHRPEAANDDHPSTIWYAANGALQFFEIVLPIDVTATRIEAVSPGARNDGFGSSNQLTCFGRFELFDESGAVLFDTGEVNAPRGILNGGGETFTAAVPAVGGVRRLRYTQTQGCDAFGGGPGSYPVGFTALRLFGSPSVPVPRLDMFERFQSLTLNNIHSTPLVANLTDDNGDGRIDRADTPDIVTLIEGPGSQVTGTMKVLSGDDGRELFSGGANSVAPWSEPAVGDLDGDGIPEIVAVHSDGNHLIAFTPASGDVQGNLTQLVQPLTFNASSTNGSFPPALAADGNLNTEWLTISIGAGTSPFYELAFPQNVEVSELRMFGSRHLTVGHDIFAGKFELFAADGTLLFDSGEVSLPAPNQDATVPAPNVVGVRRVRFTATAFEGTEPGFAELEVIGSATLPANVGRVLWVSDAHTQSTFFNGATVVTGAVAIANLDGAGAPEIIVGAAVYDADGKFLGDGASLGGTRGGGTGVKRSAISVVADIDLDGVPELVAGPTAYQLRSGGLVKVWQRDDRPDGFAALGTFDADPESEIVIVADGQVYMVNHDGSDAEVWNPPTHAPIALPGGGSGGAPTIGDFDGDGVPEIGIAGSFGYTVLERDGSTLWKTAIMDYSSNTTGSTVFDFEQDGSVEVIYRDERFMRIYRGTDGLLLAKEEIHSVTWTEEPVVADVDGDGDAEIIVCGDLSGGSPERRRTEANQGTPGIHVFEDPAAGWAPTRRIWNQHGYHITNVNEDGTVPLVETPNWLAPGLNNFRLNTFGPDDVRGFDDSFAYYANDGALDSAEAIVRIRIDANRPPTIVSTPPTTASSGLRYTYAAQATDPDTGDTLTFSLPLAPAGMTVDGASGLVGWTPAADQLGDHNVTVRVQDGAENVALQKYVITVSQSDPRDVDDDGDGLAENQGDCDDTDPTIRPGIVDPFGDGIDQDCDGVDGIAANATDDDGDGFNENQGDCSDANAAIHPGATDPFGDGIDQDCDGADGIAGHAVDDDGDGFSENQGDCNDADPAINPDATDLPGDGIDQNCNGADAVAGDDTFPTAEIVTPADLAEVTAPTDIVGTADDANFLRYTLELARVDETAFTTIGSGSAHVTNGVLGQLDPTLLENGLYTVRLIAEDANGQQSTTEVAYQISGDMKVGNFRLSFIDLSVPVSGIPITVVRSYDSRVKTKEDFGIGWTLDIRRGFYKNNRPPGQGWDIRSRPTPLGPIPCQTVNELQSHLTEIRLSDREFYTFALTLSNPAGLGGGCEATADFRLIEGSTPGATLQSLDGTQVIYQNGDDKVVDPGTFLVYDPVNVRLTTSDGRIIDLVRRGGITRIEDLNGNQLSITATGIAHSSGKSIAFTRDTQGRVTRITDPNGNALTYGYDASGDLVAFIDQAANQTTFDYDTRHNLLEIVDPLGNRAVRTEYDADGRLVATIDASGNRNTVTHDLTARQEIITDRLGNATVFEYDERGNVLSRTDPLGNVTSYTYDARDNTLSETDPLGNTRSYTYDASDNKLSETDALGNTTRFTYDSRHQQLTRTDPLGAVSTRTYDQRGNLSTETDPLGNTTVHAYAAAGGNRSSTTDALGNRASYEYDLAGREIRTTDPLGNVTDRTFDANGNALSETTTRVVGGTPQTVMMRFEYDGRNRPIREIDPEGGVRQVTYTPTGREDSTTDPLGRVTRNTYDAQGRLTGTTYPDGTTETATYDAEGRRVDSTDRAGRKTIYAFDPAGRLTDITNPDGTTLANVYDEAGRVVSAIDESAQTINFAYDAVGQLTSASDPLGGTTTTAYDATGKVASQTDPNGNTTSFTYDLAGRLTTQTFADGTSTSNAYDALGRLEATTDQSGNTTRYEYDARGDLVAVIDALGNRTRYAYDALRNRISDVDPLGNTTRYEHDRARRQITKTLPLGQTETRSYDPAGDLTAVRDFNGQTTTFEYDTMGRLVRRTFPGEVQEFTYTAAGKTASIDDAHGTTSFAYDLRDRPVVVRQPDGTELRYAYDNKGNRTAVTTPAGTVAYAYDGASRLTTVADQSGASTAYEYDQGGNLTGVRLPNGITEARAYDRLYRLTDLLYSSSGGTLLSYSYALGATGNRERVVESTGRQVDYTYDALQRIVEEQITSAAPMTIAYTYDAAGNRLTLTDQGGTTTYTYDANHRLTIAGETSFSYDSNGNLVSQTTGAGTTTYAVDALNRLTATTAPGGATTTYGYDALGNRVTRADDAGATTFLVDVFDPSGLPQVLRETDGSGAVVDYVYGGKTPLSQERDGATSFYLRDGYGSTRALASSDGTPTDGFEYDAFGNLLRRSGLTENAYLYNGQQFDPSLGLYFLRARYYDPALGRFTARDPLTGDIFQPASRHPYTYAHNDPVNLEDPTGMTSLGEVSAAVSIANVLSGLATGLTSAFLTSRVTDSNAAVGGAFLVGFTVGYLKVGPVVVQFFRLGAVDATGVAREIALIRAVVEAIRSGGPAATRIALRAVYDGFGRNGLLKALDTVVRNVPGGVTALCKVYRLMVGSLTTGAVLTEGDAAFRQIIIDYVSDSTPC